MELLGNDGIGKYTFKAIWWQRAKISGQEFMSKDIHLKKAVGPRHECSKRAGAEEAFVGNG